MMQTLIEEVDIEIPAPFMDLYSPYRYKAYFGGRGSAKSHSFAKALLCEGYDKKLRILCGREVQRSIKDSVKLLLDDQIEILGLQDHYTSLQNEIRGANGTVFLFAGLGAMTTDQIKSMEGIDRCWIEEAQTISQRSLEVLIPTIRQPGSQLWFSWNPRNANDPVDKLFRSEVTPQRGYVLDDVSRQGTPSQWANRAISVFDKWEADAIVIEINQGGDMVRHTLESIRPGIPIVEVRATRGKHIRAEPISSLYSLGRISHVGTFSLVSSVGAKAKCD